MSHLSSAPLCLRAENSVTSVAPLDVWIAVKNVLRRELGEREWEMWIQHARLWTVGDEGSSDQTLAVLMPRNGRAIFGANRYYKRVRQLAGKMMFGVIMMPATDMAVFRAHHEAFEGMEDSPRKKELLAKWERDNEFLSRPFLEEPCSPLWKEAM